jgi:hypothetical protein
MVTYYLPVSGTTSYLVYTFIIPPNFQGTSMNVNVPIGAIMAGSSSTGTITISGIGATSATILQNGNAYFTQSFTSSNATSKSFNITTANTTYSAYSYFNSYAISFPIALSTTQTYTYTCYLNFQTQNQLGAGQNYPLYNCTNQTTLAYVPSNYGIVINPVSSTSTLTNCTYATGSSNTTGYISYGYSVSGVSIPPPTTYTGYAIFDNVYSSRLTITDKTTTPASANNGTLILKHNTSGGSSSIVFSSTVNAGDYGYIQFDDNRGSGESNKLTIGTNNDADDDIYISPSGRVYITKNTYCSNWVRVSGNEGFYLESWGGGWHMTDTTYMRCYNDKKVYTGSFFQQGQLGGGICVATNNNSSYYVSNMKYGPTYIQMNKYDSSFNDGGAIGFNYFNSDLRLKENIGKPMIDDACDFIKKINFVSFQWKDREHRTNDGVCELGIIAQELETIYPDLIQTMSDVDTFEDGIGTKAVNTNCFSTFMMKGIQELILKNEKQQTEIDILKEQVALLLNKI